MPPQKPRRRKSQSTVAPDEIRRRLAEGDLSPLYFLYGPESFERDSLLAAIVEAAVPEESRAFNLDVSHAADLDPADTVNRAMAFPMVAARRMVVVKGVDRLPESAIASFISLIQAPPETTVLVLTADAIDARKKLFSQLRSSAVCVEFKTPYEDDIPRWIHGRMEAEGKRIDADASGLLQLRVGCNLRDLANEIEKLLILVGEKETVTREDVASSVTDSRTATVFELADAVGRRDPPAALARLRHLMDQGESPIGAVALLIRHINILRKARWLRDSGLPRSEVARRLKLPVFFLKNYQDQAANFDDASLYLAFDALHEADDHLKSRPDPDTALTRLICRLCRRPTAAARS
ncbi:MAG: DNA polymerase III subunit delta [Candidatus Latescibacteria bacterium]|jgi:DNA polymerase-3 subunit delta|nr:DNA polymerase III subunit delta [Candidatus Latescibacterota bacterium]